MSRTFFEEILDFTKSKKGGVVEERGPAQFGLRWQECRGRLVFARNSKWLERPNAVVIRCKTPDLMFALIARAVPIAIHSLSPAR